MALIIDIRLMIYKLLFVRPICISPAVNFYRHKPKGGTIKYSVTDINGPTNANNFRNGTMATFQAEKVCLEMFR